MALPPFTIHWTPEGIVHHPQPTSHGAWGSLFDRHPLQTQDLRAVALRWADPWSLSVAPRWPRARVRWGGGTLAIPPPPSLSVWSMPEEDAGANVAALVARLEERAPAKIRSRGWMDVPEMPWERASGLSAIAGAPSAGQGPLRTGGGSVQERAIGVRPGPSPFEAMLGWLASSTSRPWREHPREVCPSRDHLYAVRRDRTVWRLPLDSLRARHGPAHDDAVYVFGRRTRVVLTHREGGCSVRERLDARLEEAGWRGATSQGEAPA